MTFDRKDFSRIWVSLLAAVLMLAAGVALAWLSSEQLQSARQSKSAAAGTLAEFDGKLKQVRAEEAEIKEKAALFERLRTRGVIGEEQRLDWVELIKDVRDTRRLLDVQYEFAPQQVIPGASLPSHSFRSSTMQLRMKLLHEGDLLNFINDVRDNARAYVRVRSCNVARIPRNAAASGETALLSADCELEWITILPTKGAS